MKIGGNKHVWSVARRSTDKSNNDVESESDESDDGDSAADGGTYDHSGTGNDMETEHQRSFSPTQWVVVKYCTKRSVLYLVLSLV